ncbi:MAG: DegT/DnrJ/EryC1/StrS family aminotransferase [Candidatus Saliniplasma sp.]
MVHIANPVIKEEELEGIKEVLDSGMLAQGEVVADFEKEFADYLGVKYGKAVANGTAALDVAMKSLGIGEGDEVITSPFSFIASANCIMFQGAKPVFADIKDDTFNLDPEKVKEKITEDTKAILPVHLFGQPADMSAFVEIAEEHDLYLIEDCAQAHGAEYDGKKVGSFGDIGTFSFYPTKNMTTGEGGIVVTDDEELAERADLVRDHGQSEKYTHDMLGYNLRMTNIAASIGRAQLERLDEFNEKRIRNAEMLTSGIEKIKGLTPPKVEDYVKHVFHQYIIKVEEEYPLNRQELREKLHDNDIGTAVHYPKTIPEQPLYSENGYSSDGYPKANDCVKKVLSLPIHPKVSENDIEDMLEVLEV